MIKSVIKDKLYHFYLHKYISNNAKCHFIIHYLKNSTLYYLLLVHLHVIYSRHCKSSARTLLLRSVHFVGTFLHIHVGENVLHVLYMFGIPMRN